MNDSIKYNLNVPIDNQRPYDLAALLRLSQKFGYDYVALSHTIEGVPDTDDACSNTIEPLLTEVSGVILNNDRALRVDGHADRGVFQWQQRGRDPPQHGMPRVLTRATVRLDSNKQVHSVIGRGVGNPILKSYDMVAMQPMTEDLFKQCCNTIDLDIIVIDLSNRTPFAMKFNTLGLAVERGLVFEIDMGNILGDMHQLRSFMSNAMNLIRVCKGRNVVLTCGVTNVMHLRAPADLVNFAVMLGLKSNLAIDSVSSMARKALVHGEVRRTALGMVSVEVRSDTDKETPGDAMQQ